MLGFRSPVGFRHSVGDTYESQSTDKRRHSLQFAEASPPWPEEFQLYSNSQEKSISCPDTAFYKGPVPRDTTYLAQRFPGYSASQSGGSGRPVPPSQLYPPHSWRTAPQYLFYASSVPQSQPFTTYYFSSRSQFPGALLDNAGYEQYSPAHSPLSSPTDPLANMVIYHPSYWEFQRRGEDEMAKFFHLVIEYASQLDAEKVPQGLNYEDPSSKKIHKNAKEAIGTDSLDFRWQMKHLQSNLTAYSRYVFRGAIKADELKQQCGKLKRKADEMAHKQHLYKAEQPGGTRNGGGVLGSIREFFETGTNLVKSLLRILNSQINGLAAHASNLQGIYDSFEQLICYRFTYKRNKEVFQGMNAEQRHSNSRVILAQLSDLCKTSEDCYHIVAVEFASHCNQDIKTYRSSSTEDSIHLGWKRAGREFNPFGPIIKVQDNVVGQSEYDMDPFCPSNIEIQQRGEDKMALFFREVMHYAAVRQGLPIRYKDLESKGIFITAKEALGRPCSYDFRLLMDHLINHSSVYTQRVFPNALKRTDIEVYCSQLKMMAERLAHKSHLKSRHACKGQSVTSGAGTTETLSKFFEYGVHIVDEIFEDLAHIEVAHVEELRKHRDGLHKISSALDAYIEYRKLHRRNMSAYRQMSPTQQKQVAHSLIEFLKEDDCGQYEPLIMVEFTARLGWDVAKLLTKPPETFTTQTALKLTQNRFESLSTQDTSDDIN